MRWPHMHTDQVHGLSLREIGGGFTRHHRAPSIRSACYAIAKPSTMVQKMQNIKKTRGHRNAVYCAIFDRSGRYVITGSDDRLVKIWSMETAYCLTSCRGHEGDITDLAVSSNNSMVASSSNDCIIRVWRLPDGLPVSVLRGHTGAVTAIEFRPGSAYHLLSSSDDGTCRIWDVRNSSPGPRIYVPKPAGSISGKNNGASSSAGPQSHQIFCCAFNANGTVFVTGSSDTLARVWNACKPSLEDSGQPMHEIDVLSGHENDVNYVQFSGCAVTSRFYLVDSSKEDGIPKFRNSWFSHDNIVTCSRDGSAIIWIPRSRRSHGKVGRWTRAYHLKVPPPPLPPQPPRGGPRQRVLPTPRGVNMIVWSLDNRFVLAAIMDCRICVWNAADGSLVHSLTGHTESTYVLDVHPFNPRIAMSAGYDGRAIVWDIWEGVPIRTYEISRFKLVDGKFSPDGTSIILSDDVGQLYILNTGQGESQEDAKYDQFFLGDYRPLIQDTYGNVVDRETQLLPYVRNRQDLLCDSAMEPYPEPYQSSYQKRRLGALGLEWKPCSLNLAVGPDFSVDPDYQMLPLPDLDVLVDPLPELIATMDWEPEIEVHSDDADSEYNVTDGYSSGQEQGSLGSNSSSDPECTAGDSEVEDALKHALRRSKRKKQKSDIEIMTSSGRRVKRRNLEANDGNSFRSNRTGKSKIGQKALKRRSSTSKSLRPKRAAARNALTLFSRISGTSTDGDDEDVSVSDSSENEDPQDSSNESQETDGSLQNEQARRSKGKEIYLESIDNVKSHELPESQMITGNRRRLILKLPIKDSNKLRLQESASLGAENQVAIIGSSSNAAHEAVDVNGNKGSSDSGYTAGDTNCNLKEIQGRGQLNKVESHPDLNEGYKNGNIRWGGVKPRSSKRLRLTELTSLKAYGPLGACRNDCREKENNVNGYLKPEKEHETPSACLEVCDHESKMDESIPLNGESNLDGSSDVVIVAEEACNHASSKMDGSAIADGEDDLHGPSEVLNSAAEACNHPVKIDISAPFNWACDGNGASEVVNGAANTKEHSDGNENGASDHRPEIIERLPPNLRIRSNSVLMIPEMPLQSKVEHSAEIRSNGAFDLVHGKTLDIKQDSVSEVPQYGGTSSSGLRGGGAGELDPCSVETSTGALGDSQLNPKRMYDVVYRRSKTLRDRSNLEGDGGMRASTSNAVGVDSHEEMTEGVHRTHQTDLNGNTHNGNIENNELKMGQGHLSENAHRSTRNNNDSSRDRSQRACEEWGSTFKMTVGLRSTRNRRSSYHFRDTSPIDKKSHQVTKEGSWLLLSMPDEGSRYIPQLGDEVVYLRQGHQEYIEGAHSKEVGPWTSIGGNIRAVEFCKVVGLKYSTVPSGDSCCKMALQFVDPSSSVCGKSFKLTLPEITGFPDFIVERSRFDAAMQRNWSVRDKCRVWWKNPDEKDGRWWDGRVVSVQPKSPDFPDSPWDRFSILYKSQRDKESHSPWELFDSDLQYNQPHIDDHQINKLLSAFDNLEQSGTKAQDRYGIRKFNEASEKSVYRNRFPVPLSLDLIHSRLKNNYYRSLEGLKHDIGVMLENAESYFGKNAELLAKMRRLSDWFTRTLSSL
ncbi:PH-interacting protein-like isoform X2 [Tripterygium wilfordii]|nr:PH-interacting protein-like isoform X2 [Tripterygium wilfordii]